MAAHAPCAQSYNVCYFQPKRVKCGEVYTWECVEDGGELYVIECALCQEKPICGFNEFEEHMEIWHSSWEKQIDAEETVDDARKVIERPSDMEVTNQFEDFITCQEPILDEANWVFPEPFEEVLIADDSESDLQMEEISKDDFIINIEQEEKSNGIDLKLHQSQEYIYDSSSSMVSNSKLTHDHIDKLIDLFRNHARLWNQSHCEFGNTQLNRLSWQKITSEWNEYCQKSFSIAEVRVRVSTLCQRFLKEQERLENEGELDAATRFEHYEKLKFLEEQQSFKKRRFIIQKQNVKLLEIYEHFPILWHSSQKYVKCPKKRETALSNISTALKLCSIRMSAAAAAQRIHSLRKCYRIEKIRYLHCMVEGKEFIPNFKHWNQMSFLYKHIEPFVCSVCGKIFESLVIYRGHMHNEQHLVQEQMPIEPVIRSAGQVSTAQNKSTEHFNEHRNDEQHIEVIQKVHENLNVDTQEVDNSTLANSLTNETSEHKESRDEADSSAAADTHDAHPSQEPNDGLVAKVQYATFSYDVNLDEEMHTSAQVEEALDIVEEGVPDGNGNSEDEKSTIAKSGSFVRLTVKETRKLIKLYKCYPQLWDPNHLDYHSRRIRRGAWRSLTATMNKVYNSDYAWKTIHRKLTDFVKYYKREKERMKTTGTKWCFYDDFSFMDDVLHVASELQRSQQTKSAILQIIASYKKRPQLWDTTHPDFSHRTERKGIIVAMCAELQEFDIQITPEKLRLRLADLRGNYRSAKKERLAAATRNETFHPQYEYYKNLEFLDPHVAPFECYVCNDVFKSYTDFVRHKREHEKPRKKADTSGDMISISADNVENVCHICGIKFTQRNNLIIHLKRHLGQRPFKCSTCPKKFFNSTACVVHERSHTKHYPYVCEECGKAYVNASKLNQHKKRHRDQRDHVCRYCDKKFFSAFARDRHIRRHLDIRDKVCPTCGKTFVVGSSYYAHLMLHSETKRFACDRCGKRFAQYAGLYKHRKSKYCSA